MPAPKKHVTPVVPVVVPAKTPEPPACKRVELINARSACIQSIEDSLVDKVVAKSTVYLKRGSDNSSSESSESDVHDVKAVPSSSASSSTSDGCTPKVRKPQSVATVPYKQARAAFDDILMQFQMQQVRYHQTCIQMIGDRVPAPTHSDEHTVKRLTECLRSVPVFSNRHSYFYERLTIEQRSVWVLCIPGNGCGRQLSSLLEGMKVAQDSRDLVVWSITQHEVVKTVDVSPNDYVNSLPLFNRGQIFCIAESHGGAKSQVNRVRTVKVSKLEEGEALARFTNDTLPHAYTTCNKYRQIVHKGGDDILLIRHVFAGTHDARINDHESLQRACSKLISGDIPKTKLELHPENAQAFVAAMGSTESNGGDQNKMFRRLHRFAYKDGKMDMFGKGNATAEWTAINMISSIQRTLQYVRGEGTTGIIFVKSAS